MHPGGIKTAVARNATVADGQNVQSLAAFFDKRLAIHTPEMAAETIVNAVAKGRARVVVGWEAKALDGSLASSVRRINGSSHRGVEVLPLGEVTGRVYWGRTTTRRGLRRSGVIAAFAARSSISTSA